MASIYLVGCGATKRSTAAKAKDLFISALFTKSRSLAEARSDSWYVLSGKYGLLSPEVEIEPYDEYLGDKSPEERRAWSAGVLDALRPLISPGDEITILAGRHYCDGITPGLRRAGCVVSLPMGGMQFERRLQWLNGELERVGRSGRP